MATTKKRRNAADERGLTDLERRFALLYLRDFNAAGAYRDAVRGRVSENTARVNGHRLLQRPDVQALVRVERDRLLGENDLSAKQALSKLRDMLMFDPRQLFGPNGDPLPIQQIPDALAFSLAGLEVLEQWEGAGKDRRFIGYVKKYKLVDRVSVLDKAMKYHGLFERDNKQAAEAIAEVVFRGVAADGRTVEVPSAR